MTMRNILGIAAQLGALLILGGGLATGAPAGTAETAAAPDHDSPEAELASFHLPEGFQAELFASEADGVVKPVQIQWDSRGRLWVIGSQTYPQIKPGEEPNDKVLILEDPERTGHVQKVSVFADGFMIPTGLEVDGDAAGCYIGEGTKLWHLRDISGSGHAEQREIVVRGFGTGDNHQNLNSFLWSPEGDLMFCQGLHSYARVETRYGIAKLDQAGLWRLDPRAVRLSSFWGSAADPQNPWGWVFTDGGEPLVVAGNNGGVYYPVPEMIAGHDDRRAGNIWVNARGRKSSGPDIVGTAHFPPEWQGVMLDGGYINNAVWSLKIEDDGAGFRAKDLPPLITSGHRSFRPVDLKIGPDGAAYIADWYNPIIGHYQASFRDPNRDKTHGRIWRVTYKGRPLADQKPLADAPIEQLFDCLKSPERWTRYQAKRVLASRPSNQVAAIRRWLRQLDDSEPETDRALIEALGVLESHDLVEPELLRRLVKAKLPEARAHAAGAIVRWMPELPADFDAVATLTDLAHDEVPRVRLCAIVAAANIPSPESIVVALSAAEQPRDRFIDSALHQAVVALKPQWEPLLPKAETLGWKPEWIQFLAKNGDALVPLNFGPASDARTLAMMRTAAAKPVGKLRATPEYVQKLAGEARTKGDAKRGGTIFHRPELSCTGCHSVEGQGGNIGPPLDAVGSAQPMEFIIGAVLEPQREVKEGYEAVEVTLKDGRMMQGYRQRETPSELTIRDVAQQKEVALQKSEIVSTKEIGSLMPGGLLDNLSRQDLGDLFRYLSELGKPVEKHD